MEYLMRLISGSLGAITHLVESLRTGASIVVVVAIMSGMMLKCRRS
jgi:hypothetical protein